MKFIEKMKTFDKENVEEKMIVNLGKFIKDPKNEPILELDNVKKSSEACVCIIQWVKGIYDFYWVWKKVKPK